MVELAPVFDRLSRAVDAEQRGRSEPVSWREVLLGQSLPETPRRVLVVQPIVNYSALIPAEEAIARIHEVAESVGLDGDSGVRVRVTGELALSSEELETVTRGTALSGILSFIAVTGILFFGLRSWKLMAATSLTLSIGLVWTFAFATVTVGSLNMVSVAFAVLFIGLGDDFGVHFCLRWQDLYGRGLDSAGALRETAKDVGLSLLLCAVTVAIGFLAFAPTDYVGVAELGVISAGGIILSVISSLTLLPALITLFKPAMPKPRVRRPASALWSRVVAFPGAPCPRGAHRRARARARVRAVPLEGALRLQPAAAARADCGLGDRVQRPARDRRPVTVERDRAGEGPRVRGRDRREARQARLRRPHADALRLHPDRPGNQARDPRGRGPDDGTAAPRGPPAAPAHERGRARGAAQVRGGHRADAGDAGPEDRARRSRSCARP